MPSSVTFSGVTTNFVYDGSGARVKKITSGITTLYISKIYECTNGSCGKYVFAGDTRVALKRGTEVLYYHQDHLNSSSIITDATGTKVEEIYYYPFGGTRTDTGSISVNHKYTSQELDGETGLYYYGARYYNPQLGRFISPDSIIPDPFDPQAFNRYSYVFNNPLFYRDPTGNEPGENGIGEWWCYYVGIGCGEDIIDNQEDECQCGIGQSYPTQNYNQDSDVIVLGDVIVTGIRDSGFSSDNTSSYNVDFWGSGPSDPIGDYSDWFSGTKDYLEERAVDQLSKGNTVAGFIDTLGIAVIDTFLPSSYYEIPLMFMGGIGKAGGNAVIGKLKDLEKLLPGEHTLIKHMPNLGSYKANWYQNARVLRIEMSKGRPIRDASTNAAGDLINNTGFLRAERNLLENSGWQYDKPTRFWIPPE